MCRFVGYTGAPTTLASVLLDAPVSLLVQSYAPRHQAVGRFNGDGWGVGWYDPRRPEPARYRSAGPMWSDASFASIAGVIETSTLVAAVRNASVGMPVAETNSHPFTDGAWLFTHNGVVDGFTGTLGVELRRGLSERRAADITGSTDSEVMFAMVLDLLDAGTSPPDALDSVVADVLARTTSRLNLLLARPGELYATRCGDSLWTRHDEAGVVVVSEPYDEHPGWTEVAEGAVVGATPAGVDVRAMRPS
jgi:glutamine amidotransferase